MDPTKRLFSRQKSVHEILGGGLAADVILWRRKNISVGILLVTLAVWVVFERSGYTLLSLLSNVLLLLITILFLWAKSASILNRPAPPLPELHLSEETAKEMSTLICTHVNNFFSISLDIMLGRNSRMFFKVASYLLLISFIGSLTDFLTLAYTSLVIVLTIPALYEKYEDHVDRYGITGYKYGITGCRTLRKLYVRFDVECLSRVQNMLSDKEKLS